MSFDYPHSLREEYERRLRARVEAAAQTIERVFARLEGMERASPATWDAALREAEAAYNEAFGPQAQLELARQIVDSISEAQAQAWADEFGTAAQLVQMPRQQRLEAVQTQLDAIQALVDKYYANLRDVETDDQGFIVLATASAAIERERGVADRRAKFYATDQTGQVYSAAQDHAFKRTGSPGYIWLRTTSANPRDRHLARVGNTYRWGEVSDEPGDLYNCKCGAKPITP